MSAYDIAAFGTRYDKSIVTSNLRLINGTPSSSADSQASSIDFYGTAIDETITDAHQHGRIRVSTIADNNPATAMKFQVLNGSSTMVDVFGMVSNAAQFLVPVITSTVDSGSGSLVFRASGVDKLTVASTLITSAADIAIESSAPKLISSQPIAFEIGGASAFSAEQTRLKVATNAAIGGDGLWYIKKSTTTLATINNTITIEPTATALKVATTLNAVDASDATILRTTPATGKILTNLAASQFLVTDSSSNLAALSSFSTGTVDLGSGSNRVKTVFATTVNSPAITFGSSSGLVFASSGVLSASTTIPDATYVPTTNGGVVLGTSIARLGESFFATLNTQWVSSGIIPVGSGQFLGSSANRWDTLYAQSINVNQSITLNAFGGTTGYLTVDADGVVSVSAGGGGGGGAITNIIPDLDSTYSLGSSSFRWANVFGKTIDIAAGDAAYRMLATNDNTINRLRLGAGVSIDDTYVPNNATFPVFYEIESGESAGQHRFYVATASAATMNGDSTLPSSFLRATIDNDSLSPASSSGITLGNTSKRWSMVYAVNTDVDGYADIRGDVAIYGTTSSNKFRVVSGTATNIMIVDTLTPAVYINSLVSVTGNISLTGELLTGAGDANQPSYSFGSDTSTGFYSSNTGVVSYSSDGTECMNFGPTLNLMVPIVQNVSVNTQSQFRKDSDVAVTAPLRLSNSTLTADGTVGVQMQFSTGTSNLDNYIGVDGSGQLIFTSSGSALIPAGTNATTTTLGSSSARWSNMYSAGMNISTASSTGDIVTITNTNPGGAAGQRGVFIDVNTTVAGQSALTVRTPATAANISLDLISGVANGSTTAIRMSSGTSSGTAIQTGTITFNSGGTPLFLFSRAITCTSITCVGASIGNGALTGSGNWTITTGVLTSTAVGGAGYTNRIVVANTSNANGSSVGMTWTAGNSAGNGSQSGRIVYKFDWGWRFDYTTAGQAGITPTIRLGNASTSTGAGTSFVLEGQNGSGSQAATLSYDGTDVVLSSTSSPSNSITFADTTTFRIDNASLTSPVRLYNASGSVSLGFQAISQTGSIQYSSAGTFTIAGNVSTTGTSTIAGQTIAQLGSVSAPAYTFSGMTSSGIYGTTTGAGEVLVALSGNLRFRITDANTLVHNNFIPGTTNTHALGSDSLRWSTVFTTGLNASGTVVSSASVAGSSVRLTLSNTDTTNSSTVALAWTAATAAGGGTQTGSMQYWNQGWILRQPNTVGVVNCLRLSNLDTTAASGTSMQLEGYSGGARRTATLSYDGTNVMLNTSNNTGYFGPTGLSSMTFGTSSNTFASGWIGAGIAITSDMRAKNNIVDEPLGIDFINDLRPVSYRYNVKHEERDSEGNIVPVPGVRHHHGLIAQEVKQAITKYGMSDVDFAGYIYDADVDKHALRYDEFIAPMIKAIQQMSQQIASLNARLAAAGL